MNIFSLEISEDEAESQIEAFDRRKIDSLNWLLYDQQQRSEAILMANALTRSFVASYKYEHAKDCWYGDCFTWNFYELNFYLTFSLFPYRL